MGNTLGTDMGDTFSATGRRETRVCRSGRTAAHSVASPVILTFRGLRRCVQQFLFNIRYALARGRKCHPCLCPKCYPCVCPFPTPALPLRERGPCRPLLGMSERRDLS